MSVLTLSDPAFLAASRVVGGGGGGPTPIIYDEFDAGAIGTYLKTTIPDQINNTKAWVRSGSFEWTFSGGYVESASGTTWAYIDALKSDYLIEAGLRPNTAENRRCGVAWRGTGSTGSNYFVVGHAGGMISWQYGFYNTVYESGTPCAVLPDYSLGVVRARITGNRAELWHIYNGAETLLVDDSSRNQGSSNTSRVFLLTRGGGVSGATYFKVF